MYTSDNPSQLLALPLEVRLHIWSYLLTPYNPLRISSLFIRNYYRSVFMSQQLKQITTALLLINKQISAEALPILYSQPFWRAGCRFEALASQIGIENFCLIKTMSVDVDDLPAIVGSLQLDLQELDPQSLWTDLRLSSLDMKLAMESDAILYNMVTSSDLSTDRYFSDMQPASRRLRFTNLEVLEVEGYQTMALTSRGNRKSRTEGLRLCKFVNEIISYHPSLAVLVQQEKMGNGGSDAVDFTMGRVRWRFLRHEGCKASNEHVVDVRALQHMLEALVAMDEEVESVRERRTFANWTSGGTYQQYPYLMGAVAGA